MRKSLHYALMGVSGAALGGVALASGAAIAQDGSADTDADGEQLLSLEEIVVTALGRDTSLLDAPASVAVFNSEFLDRAAIERPGDLVRQIPNAVLIDTNIEGEAFLVLRGLAPARNAEASTAIIVDGVLATGPNELNQDFFDVQSIEVLKGPQSALYGRNATGGAVVIRTVDPTDEWEGKVKVGYGGSDRVLAQLSGGGAVIEDKLFFRGATSFTRRGGKLRNDLTGEERDRFQRFSGRIRADWQVNDALTVDFRGNYGRVRDAGGINARAFFNLDPADNFDVVNLDRDEFPPFENNNQSFNEQDRYGGSVKIDWETEHGTLILTSAYSFVEDFYGQDNFPYAFGDPSPVPDGVCAAETIGADGELGDLDGDGIQDDNDTNGDGIPDGCTQILTFSNEIASQEIRWQSAGDRRFRYVVGGYFASINQNRATIIGEDLGQGIIRSRSFDINPIESRNPTAAITLETVERTNFAGFVNLEFDILDNLMVTAGVRYDNEEATATNLIPDPAFTNDFGAVISQRFEDFAPKVSVSYRPTDDINIYASYGQGFKAGGFNFFGTSAGVAAIDPDAATIITDDFGEELQETYEAGFKGRFFDGRLLFNAAGFYSDITNLQVFEFLPALGLQTIIQVDQAEVIGFELDVLYEVTERLSIQGAFGYTEATVEELLLDPTLEGNRTPYTPKTTANLAATYVHPVTETLDLYTRVDWNRIGSTFWNVNNTIGSERNQLSLINIGMGLEAERWRLSATIKNVANKAYISEAVILFPGVAASFQGPPRYWTADFTYKF